MRSLEGMNLISETMERLQWRVFFDEHGVDRFVESLQFLREIKEKVGERDRDASRTLLYSFISSPSADGLVHDLEEFRSEKRKESETFQYWDTFIQMMRLVKDLVRVDREGDWALHLQSVEAALQ